MSALFLNVTKVLAKTSMLTENQHILNRHETNALKAVIFESAPFQ